MKMYSIEEVTKRSEQAIAEGVSLIFQGDGGVTIRNRRKGTEYTMSAHGRCSCPGATFHGHCKHEALVIRTRQQIAGKGDVFRQKAMA